MSDADEHQKYVELLQPIRDRAISYGESLQPPCSGDALSECRSLSRTKLGTDIPAEYRELLSVANGLDWNGLVIYATERSPIAGHSDRFIEGFIDGNLDDREFEPMNDFLIFADDGDTLYTRCISKDRFQVVTSVGLSVLEDFDSFDQLISNASEAHM